MRVKFSTEDSSYGRLPHAKFHPIVAGVGNRTPKTANFTKFWNMDTPLDHIRCAILTIADPFVLFVFVHHAFERWRLWTRYTCHSAVRVQKRFWCDWYGHVCSCAFGVQHCLSVAIGHPLIIVFSAYCVFCMFYFIVPIQPLATTFQWTSSSSTPIQYGEIWGFRAQGRDNKPLSM